MWWLTGRGSGYIRERREGMPRKTNCYLIELCETLFDAITLFAYPHLVLTIYLYLTTFEFSTKMKHQGLHMLVFIVNIFSNYIQSCSWSVDIKEWVKYTQLKY